MSDVQQADKPTAPTTKLRKRRDRTRPQTAPDAGSVDLRDSPGPSVGLQEPAVDPVQPSASSEPAQPIWPANTNPTVPAGDTGADSRPRRRKHNISLTKQQHDWLAAHANSDDEFKKHVILLAIHRNQDQLKLHFSREEESIFGDTAKPVDVPGKKSPFTLPMNAKEHLALDGLLDQITPRPPRSAYVRWAIHLQMQSEAATKGQPVNE